MKKLLTLLTSAIGMTAAFGVTPVAVWDGDFTTMTKGTYTLSENGNTKTDSYLQISGDNGILLTSTDALNVFTVIMRCSGLDLSSANTQVLFTSYATVGDTNNNLTGVNLPANNAVCRGIWKGADWNNNATQGSVPVNYTTLIYNHQQASGTYAYALGPTSSEDDTVVRTTLYSVEGLRSSGSTYKGFAVGGLRGTTSATLLPATGLKITSLAVFSGTLSETEMKEYIFPSETQTINVTSDTTVSAINGRFDSASYKAAKVVATDGVTITVDTAFGAKILSVSSAGTITLSAASQPAASSFSNVDFSGIQGGLIRSWLTPGVVGVNFAKGYGNDVSGELVTSASWVETTGASGSSTALFADGLTKITWSSSNVYSYDGGDSESSSFLHGYLDDGNNNGHGVEVTIERVPYATYDVVIYASTDTSGAHFQAKTVNGTTYTVDATGTVSAGNGVWGSSRLEAPVYGANAMRVKNLSGPLTIYGGLNTYSADGARGGIAAIQIMPPTAEDNITEYTLALDGTAAAWTTGAWKVGTDTVAAPLTGYAKITLSASTTLTIDDTVALTRLVVDGADNAVLTLVTGSGTFVANGSVVVEGGVLQQGSDSVLGATPMVAVEDGATFDANGHSVNSATTFTLSGAGAGNWPWALTSSGDQSPVLAKLALAADATIGGANQISLGASGVANDLPLNNHTLTKVGAGNLYCTNLRFTGGGTLDLQGGTTSFNQWTSLDGSENIDRHTTVIVRSGATIANNAGRRLWIDTLDVRGGTVSTTASGYFGISSVLTGACETVHLQFNNGATATLSGDLTTTTMDCGAISFTKVSGAEPVVVTPGTFTASGAVSVGAGVTLNLGTSRPTGTITVAEGGTLAAQMQNETDIIELSTSAQPANVVLYDANGNAVSSPRVTYSNGTLTIAPPVPTLEASGTVAFDTAANWVGSTMPSENGVAIIELSADAEITVSGTYTLDSLTITGSGEATFSGNGTITAANISVRNGAAFVRNVNVSATTGIDLASGTVLRINGVTETAVVSGAGSVETYGNVDMAALNTFTGGITAKTGTLTTSVGDTSTSPWRTGFGPYQTGWANANQMSVTVESGACVDLNNVINKGMAYKLTIAGKGVESSGSYSGAVKYTGDSAQGYGSRQLSNLALTGDALVDLGAGWGLVHHSYGAATLSLNGHTLTIRGTNKQNFPMQNVTASTAGTVVLEGATLQFGANAACSLSGVTVIAKGGSKLDFDKAPSALGAVVAQPTATASVAVEGYAYMSGIVVPTVKTVNIDSSVLAAGSTITLMTTDATLTEGENVTITASSRYVTTVSGQNVTATVASGLPAPFLHYDFNAANSIAGDSLYNFGNLNPEFVSGRNGMAGRFVSGTTPWYDSNTSGKSPFYAGEMTVTTLLKVQEANNTILWNFGSGWGDGMALIAKDRSTIAVVSWTGGATGSDVVSLSGVGNLMDGKWHLVTIVARVNGTALYVDDKSASVGAALPTTIDGKGQFGSIHGTAKNYNAVSVDGYLLDDWRVYDTALTAGEIKALRKQFMPAPLLIRIR